MADELVAFCKNLEANRDSCRVSSFDITVVVQDFVSLLRPAVNSSIQARNGEAECSKNENFEGLCRSLAAKIETTVSDEYSQHTQDFTNLCGHFAKIIALILGKKVYWGSVSQMNEFCGEADRKYYAVTAQMVVVQKLDRIRKYWEAATTGEKTAEKLLTC